MGARSFLHTRPDRAVQWVPAPFHVDKATGNIKVTTCPHLPLRSSMSTAVLLLLFCATHDMTFTFTPY